jgi:hypothetical protein
VTCSQRASTPQRGAAEREAADDACESFHVFSRV